MFISDGTVMITLWQVADSTEANGFDRHHNMGQHHLALRVGSMDELNQIFRTLGKADEVKIESPPIPLGSGKGAHMMCLEPGGIRIEFITRS